MSRYEEAADWFVALQRPDLSQIDWQAWEEWIADPDNSARFDEIAALWSRTKALPEQALPDAESVAADTYDGSVSVAQWRAGQAIHRRIRVRPRKALLAAAAVIMAAAIGVIFYPQYWPSIETAFLDHITRQYETGIGEHHTLSLPDGSDVVLGAKTSISVTYAHRQRLVKLNRGEVLVHVQPDPQRPFTVLAGSGSITAVGTRFAVKREVSTERVTVTVAEGVVRVEPDSLQLVSEIEPPPIEALPPPTIVTLTRGRRVSYDDHGDVSAVRPVDPASVAAWRAGRLQYRNESLHDVIADVNRYSRREIIFLDGTDQTLRYSGTVFQKDVDDWIAGLPAVFDVEIVSEDAAHVRLRSRSRAN